MAVLASYAAANDAGNQLDLDAYLRTNVFGSAEFETTEPDGADVAGFAAYLDRYHAGLEVERAAVDALPVEES